MVLIRLIDVGERSGKLAETYQYASEMLGDSRDARAVPGEGPWICQGAKGARGAMMANGESGTATPADVGRVVVGPAVRK
jgi:hypothetical protein